MRAMLFEGVGLPLRLVDLPIPKPSKHQVLIHIAACGVCRTDLHIMEGDVKTSKIPLILGHQIVGTIAENGSLSKRFKIGDKVGVSWLGKTCGSCSFCMSHRENLCSEAVFTGLDCDGGFAEYCRADEEFIFSLSLFPGEPSSIAPFLCGGLIGYRALNFAGEAQKIGFYGFGSSAHLLIQAAVFKKKEVFVFTKKGDEEGQNLAKALGASWCGSSEEDSPTPLEAAIIFAPDGTLVPKALKSLKKNGKVICAGIHMSDIPSFPYADLWQEKSICSVANLTRDDGKEFLKLAQQIPIRAKVTTYPLEKANDALENLKKGKAKGATVLLI